MTGSSQKGSARQEVCSPFSWGLELRSVLVGVTFNVAKMDFGDYRFRPHSRAVSVCVSSHLLQSWLPKGGSRVILPGPIPRQHPLCFTTGIELINLRLLPFKKCSSTIFKTFVYLLENCKDNAGFPYTSHAVSPSNILV